MLPNYWWTYLRYVYISLDKSYLSWGVKKETVIRFFLGGIAYKFFYFSLIYCNRYQKYSSWWAVCIPNYACHKISRVRNELMNNRELKSFLWCQIGRERKYFVSIGMGRFPMANYPHFYMTISGHLVWAIILQESLRLVLYSCDYTPPLLKGLD